MQQSLSTGRTRIVMYPRGTDNLNILSKANRTKNIVFDTSVHIHSDVRLNDSALREKLLDFLPTQSVNGTKPNVTLTLIYTNTKYLSFQLNNHKIEGEVNLVKYLATKLKVWDEIHPVDEARLDDIYNVLICDDNLKTFQSVLQEWIEGTKKFISYQDKFGVTDLLAYSHAISIPKNKWSDPVILEWIKNCSTHLSPESKEEQNSGDEKQKLFDYFNQHQIEFWDWSSCLQGIQSRSSHPPKEHQYHNFPIFCNKSHG